MKFYTITAASCFLERPQIRAFHADMFHGLAERDGQEYPHNPGVRPNIESFSPLMVSRTIRDVPEISSPGGDLVVSEELANKLLRFQNIRLAPVVFKRLVDVDYSKGDMSWFEKWGGGDPCELLRTLPEVPEAQRKIGLFFEVQTHRLKDIMDGYPLAKKITIERGTPPTHERDEIRVSTEMLRDYPMFSWGSAIVCEHVFDILDAHLDRDFFVVRKYQVP